MSLDVYLTVPGRKVIKPAAIYVREAGETKELSRAEWDERFPNKEPVTVDEADTEEVFWANITHNLHAMAEEAGIGAHLWRPEEIGVTKAAQLIEPLREGLVLMKADPARFQKHNARNGWGLYDNFVPWVERYLNACVEYPDAEVSVSR